MICQRKRLEMYNCFLFEKNLQENVNLIMEVWRVLYEISHSYQDAI